MSKKLKPGMLCFLVGPSVPPQNLNKIVKLMYSEIHPRHQVLVWQCRAMQPLVTGNRHLPRPAGAVGHATPSCLRPIDPDGTVTKEEVKELFTPETTKEIAHG
jgi:hypothetical protein